MKLTQRDVFLLLDMYKYRYLSFTQLTTLHFPSKPTAYRRIQALSSKGFLKSFTVPSIPERIFHLDKAGAEVVASELQVTVEDLQWYRYTRAPKDYFFLRHFLAINDFRMNITAACRGSALNLLGFIPEYFGEKTIQGNVRKYIRDRVCDIGNRRIEYSHTPDAVFALEKEGKAALFFLEIDRGIEILSDPEKGFLKCIVFYLNYWVDRKYRRFESDFGGREFKTFRTLICTTSQARLQHMREAVTSFSFPSPQAKRFLWGAVNVCRESLFSPVWLSLDATDDKRYQIG